MKSTSVLPENANGRERLFSACQSIRVPKTRLCAWASAAIGLFMFFPAAMAQGGGPTPSGTPAASSEIPQSIFIIPATPREGRNPFFPHSTSAAPAPVRSNTSFVDASSIMLNGLTSPPKRTAIINGNTFEVGEEHEIRLAGGGKEIIKCLEIKSDSATIELRGQRRELRLRQGVL
jgi:hypothetical protein